jgi:hypothetical protein
VINECVYDTIWYCVPDGEIVGEGISLGLPDERCKLQQLHVWARPGGIIRYTKTTDAKGATARNCAKYYDTIFIH